MLVRFLEGVVPEWLASQELVASYAPTVYQKATAAGRGVYYAYGPAHLQWMSDFFDLAAISDAGMMAPLLVLKYALWSFVAGTRDTLARSVAAVCVLIGSRAIFHARF